MAQLCLTLCRIQCVRPARRSRQTGTVGFRDVREEEKGLQSSHPRNN